MSGHGIDCHGGTTQRQQQTEHGISTAFPGMDTEELIHARMGLSVSMPCHAVPMPCPCRGNKAVPSFSARPVYRRITPWLTAWPRDATLFLQNL